MPSNSSCTLCKLHKETKHVCIWGAGAQGGLMIVLPAPGWTEAPGIPLGQGRTRAFIQEALGGHPLSQCYVTNAVKCKPQKNATSVCIRKCNLYLIEEALLVKPRVTLVLGAGALEAVLGVSGQFEQYAGSIQQSSVYGIVVVTYTPASIYVGGVSKEVIFRDFRRAVAALSGRVEVKPSKPEGMVISHDEVTIRAALEHAQNAPFVVSDVETTGLDYWKNEFQVTHYGATWNGSEGITFDPRKYPEVYQAFTKLPQVVHNSGFEGNIYTGTNIIGDTNLEAFVYKPGMRSYSLQSLSGFFLGSTPWKGNESSDWDSWAYRNALDLPNTWKLHGLFISKLPTRARALIQNIMIPAYKIYADYRRRGVYVNQKKRQELKVFIEKRLIDLKFEALTHGCGYNMGSPDQMREYLYHKLKLPAGPLTDAGMPSTDAEWLAQINHLHPVIKIIREYRTHARNYGQFLADDCEWNKEWVYPSWWMTRLITARPQPVEPTVVNVPRTKNNVNYREMLSVEDEDYVIVSGDESQIELRGMAFLSGDRAMSDTYNVGGDIHIATAIAVVGQAAWDSADKPTRKYYRTLAKSINFGYLYGASAETGRLYALKEFGIELTKAESERNRNVFFRTYSGIELYHNKVRKQILLKGFIDGVTGFHWEFPEVFGKDRAKQDQAIRWGINYPNQNFGAILMLLGVLAAEELKPGCTFMTIHDDVMCKVRKHEAEEFALEFNALWTQKVHEFYPEFTVPFEVGIGIGESYGALKEFSVRGGALVPA